MSHHEHGKKRERASARGTGGERKAGGAGPGSTATGSVAPGMGTADTTPEGDLDHPGGIGRGLAEGMRPPPDEEERDRERQKRA